MDLLQEFEVKFYLVSHSRPNKAAIFSSFTPKNDLYESADFCPSDIKTHNVVTKKTSESINAKSRSWTTLHTKSLWLELSLHPSLTTCMRINAKYTSSYFILYVYYICHSNKVLKNSKNITEISDYQWPHTSEELSKSGGGGL